MKDSSDHHRFVLREDNTSREKLASERSKVRYHNVADNQNVTVW